jgi:uncharacterized protein (TIGR03083 family)
MTKDELLALIKHERARFDDLVATLDQGKLTEPTLDGGWSVTDVLPHLAAWERRIAAAIVAALEGRVPDWPEAGYTMADTDRLNARDFAANRGRALPDVLSDAERSYEDTLDAIERLSEEDLMSPERWPWTRGHALAEFVRANTDEHYAEHADAIEAWRTARMRSSDAAR